MGERPHTAPLLSGKPCSGEEGICTGGWVGIQSRVVSHAGKWRCPLLVVPPQEEGRRRAVQRSQAPGETGPGFQDRVGSWGAGCGAGERRPPRRTVGGWTWRQDPSPRFCTQLHAAPGEQGHVMSPGTLCVGLRGRGRPGLGVQGPPAPAGPLGKQQTRSAREYPGLWEETDAWGGLRMGSHVAWAFRVSVEVTEAKSLARCSTAVTLPGHSSTWHPRRPLQCQGPRNPVTVPPHGPSQD